MSEWVSNNSSGSSDIRLNAKVNFETFADSVAFLRLTNIDDPTRKPIASFGKTQGKRTGSVFELQYVSVSAEALDSLWQVFTNGKGMLEIQPHQGPIVRALLQPLNVSGMRDQCT